MEMSERKLRAAYVHKISGAVVQNSTWSEADYFELRKLWAEGHSTQEIGRRMGFTKNAIVGKAHRLDLPARPSPITRTYGPAKPVQPPRVTGPTLPALPSAHSSVVDTATSTSPLVPDPPVKIPLPPCGHQRGTDEWGALFDKLWKDGMSSADMRQQLGLTSDGHLSQIRYRRGLSPRTVHPDSAAAVEAARKASAAPVPDKLRPSEVRFPDSVFSMRVSPMPKPQPVAPRSFGRVVSCLWPVGEPGTRGFRFCDVPSEPNRPYCADHVKIAYVHVRDRREDAA